MQRNRAIALTIISALLLSGCMVGEIAHEGMMEDAKVTEETAAQQLLRTLPPASEKIAVAVYNFDDQTGQFRQNDKLTDYSSAVTKGALAILNNALLDAGNHNWFTVIERGGLKNLLQERQIIRAMREQYAQPNGEKLPDIPPMLYAGMIIEGGIIGYDSNIMTGGAGANYFGIGGTTEYRRDTVSIYLRAVNIQTGEVLLSINTTKTIYSMGLSANISRYLTFNHLLMAETGVTLNEPAQLAVRQAIETGVYSMVMEGAIKNLWSFADPRAGQQAINAYLDRRATDTNKELPSWSRQEDNSEQVPAPAPAPAPMPVESAPAPAPVREYNEPAYVPQPQPQATMPLPPPQQPTQPSVMSAPAPQPANPPLSRPNDPRGLIKYLRDSRYDRRAQ